MLSKQQLTKVCLLNQGHEQCRYLDGDENDYNKHYCKKLSSEKAIIDEEVLIFLNDAKSQGFDPTIHNHPLGTGGNCQGFVVLKTKLQGYDVP